MTGAAEACTKGGAPAPQGPVHLQAVKQGLAMGHAVGMQPPPQAAFTHSDKVPAASHCAVDPIEAPAPAWALDPTITHHAQAPSPTSADSSSSHLVMTNREATSSQARETRPAAASGKPDTQSSWSGRPDALQSAKATEESSSTVLPALQTVTQADDASSVSREGGLPKQASLGSFTKQTGAGKWRGFAADADNTSADGSEVSSQAEAPAADAAGVEDPRATYSGASVQPKKAQQSGQQSGSAAFAGFDVPEEQVDESVAAESAPGQATHQHSPVQTSSSAAGRTTSEVWAQNAPGHIGSTALLAETETDTSVNLSTPAKPEGSSGVHQASAGPKAERTSSAVFSKGPTRDIPSDKGVAAGAVRVPKMGQNYNRVKSAQAAAPAGPVSGTPFCCLVHNLLSYLAVPV